MSEYLIQNETLTKIANAIRKKTGRIAQLSPEDMAAEIEGLSNVNLNFSVVRYEPGAILPEIAAENTFAVFTDHEITGWTFTFEEPAFPSEGMIWFRTASSSSRGFNALKQNGLYVYPTSARQYISGSWISIELQAYQNGWQAFELVLYEDGVFNTDVFGTINHNGYIHTTGTYAGSIGMSAYGYLRTTTAVDVSSYSVFQYDITTSNYGRPDVIIKNAAGTVLATTGQVQGVQTVTLDISDINEPIIVDFYVYGNSSSNSTFINNIKFTP